MRAKVNQSAVGRIHPKNNENSYKFLRSTNKYLGKKNYFTLIVVPDTIVS